MGENEKSQLYRYAQLLLNVETYNELNISETANQTVKALLKTTATTTRT